VKRNIIANATGRFWSIVSVYLFVPLYIKYLGIEAYGVIGFYAVLQGILFLADAGLSATLNRELARLSSLPDRAKEMRDLVRTIEVLYWAIAISCGIVSHTLAGMFVFKWINI
jgi:O-antigen/teichoic acid export membrane protein